ncbi:AAA family ATPase [Naasia lichenicola]|uniref:26S protease regulatory subunit n=1 Tax=Naasia lichenicola TaxID=2565933 RepID=A0A4S4FRS6_9MICO|nr:AAA family ATPase [Naasia lichenicola]THG33363.1 26S protease regulatory subunit [Naasia lichenicola]
MDDQQRDFIETFRVFLDQINSTPRSAGGLTPLGRVVQEHLGIEVDSIPLVAETIASHRLVDADIALDELAAEGRIIGATGAAQRANEPFSELLRETFIATGVGPVDYATADTGPDSTRTVIAFGIRLFAFRGSPVAVLQRGAKPEYGREAALLEVLAPDPQLSAALLAEIRRLMRERSVLRGQVLSFTGNQHGHGSAGITFLPRPSVAAEQVILAPGVLDTITRHVVDIGANRERMLAQGQHLKRGVLLYGPPGTGKTLTVRHLLARTPGTTAILLTGPSIHYIAQATELARAMPPALVVLEDVDLIATERGMYGPQPLLFAILDALDGLDGDADVTFLMTTNRVDLLESALAERPGRVDLAVEVALPDVRARRALFLLYARGLGLTDTVVEAAADRAEGVTASFAKELMRRVVLLAAEEDRPVVDADLDAALDGLLSARETLTRSLLGGQREV